MRLKMLVGLAGPTYCLNPGDEHDFPEAEALRLIAAEYAVSADKPKIERAVAKRKYNKAVKNG